MDSFLRGGSNIYLQADSKSKSNFAETSFCCCALFLFQVDNEEDPGLVNSLSHDNFFKCIEIMLSFFSKSNEWVIE